MRGRLATVLGVLFAFGCVTVNFAAPVEVPPGLDPAPLDALLAKYVDERGLVKYRDWKASPADSAALRDWLAKLTGTGATGDDRTATLINAYNALTIQWILDNYPVKSIKRTENPWSAKRHRVGDRWVSLDEIEHDTLRPQAGYRVHAVLVCAARSCPPLRNRAFTAADLSAQLDDRFRVWLAREDLNSFDAGKGRAELSKIFSWYARDFTDLPAILRTYAPAAGEYQISYKAYNWSLNEQP